MEIMIGKHKVVNYKFMISRLFYFSKYELNITK